MTDVATALAPLVPTFLDVAGILLGGLAVLAVREGVSILSHWAHVDVSAKLEASLELAASNAARAIVAKAPTSEIINEAFSVDDPRVKSAANWIVHESIQHAAAIQEFGTTVDDMAHKIVSKLGGEQTQAPAVIVEPAAPIVPVPVAKPIAAPVSVP